jgi:protein-tyrosine phosphatase
MAATPHRFHGGNENIGMDIVRRTSELQAWFDSENIALHLVPGVELTMRDDIVEQLKSGRMIPIGGPGGKAVLVEPPFVDIPHDALDLMKSIQAEGYKPILAHPERNRDIQHGHDFPKQCAELGIVLQVTAGSILGNFGPQAQSAAKNIVQHADWEVILASDAHWPYDRTPGDLNKARIVVSQWIENEELAMKMVVERPKGLVEIE